MSMTRREFMHTLALAAASGLPLGECARAADADQRFYDLGRFNGNVSVMHFTDAHAQLLPNHFREPSLNIGVGTMAGRPPHLVGAALLKHYGIRGHSRLAH